MYIKLAYYFLQSYIYIYCTWTNTAAPTPGSFLREYIQRIKTLKSNCLNPLNFYERTTARNLLFSLLHTRHAYTYIRYSRGVGSCTFTCINVYIDTCIYAKYLYITQTIYPIKYITNIHSTIQPQFRNS